MSFLESWLMCVRRLTSITSNYSNNGINYPVYEKRVYLPPSVRCVRFGGGKEWHWVEGIKDTFCLRGN